MYRRFTSVALLVLASIAGCQTPMWKNKSTANIETSVPLPIDASRPSAVHAPHVVTTPPPTGRYSPRLFDPIYGGSSGHCTTGIRGTGSS